jgi:ABC-type glycerol-3-phosphate transport system permease component
MNNGLVNKQSVRIKTIGIALKIIASVYLFVAIIAQLTPFYLKLVLSLQPFSHVIIPGTMPFWPDTFNISNYLTAWKESDMLRGFLNSVLITGGYVFISAVAVILVGYVLAKKRFRGKNFVFVLLLSTMMVPGQINMIVNFRLLADFNLLNTRFAVIAPGLVNVFGIFLARQFMESIPDSLLEAAQIDGAGEILKIFRIVLPMSMSVVATYVILSAIGSWNEYLWPDLVLNVEWLYTVQLKLMYFQMWTGESREYILRSAALISTVFPVVVIYIIFQKQFVQGMSISGLK